MNSQTQDKLVDLLAPMDEPTLKEFISSYELDGASSEMVDNWNRMLKRKTYDGLYFGLIALLSNNDYTTAKEIAVRADNGKIDELLYRIRFLIVNLSHVRHDHTNKVDQNILFEYGSILNLVSNLVTEYDLACGYFRRNTIELEQDWKDLDYWNSRVKQGETIFDSMFHALILMLKFKLYIEAWMPKELLISV